MTYPPKLKKEAIRLHKEEGRSAEQIAEIFSKEVEAGKHDYMPVPRTISNWLTQEDLKKEAEALDGLSQTMRHDKKVFRMSNKILNEKDIRRIEWNIAAGNSMLDEDIIKCEKYAWFFSYESNMYISKQLRSKCEYFTARLYELGKFIGQRFYSSDRKDESGLGQPHESRFKAEFGEEAYEGYHGLETELHKLAENALEAYKSYRATVREMMFI